MYDKLQSAAGLAAQRFKWLYILQIYDFGVAGENKCRDLIASKPSASQVSARAPERSGSLVSGYPPSTIYPDRGRNQVCPYSLKWFVALWVAKKVSFSLSLSECVCVLLYFAWLEVFMVAQLAVSAVFSSNFFFNWAPSPSNPGSNCGITLWLTNANVVPMFLGCIV